MFENNRLHFDGAARIMFPKTRDISNTFTYEFWVRADEEQILDLEKSVGDDGIHGKKYLVGPDFYPSGSAGLGISVGTNGISVYEHSMNHFPARLVYPYDFSDWKHVAVVSDNKKLRLYINGQFVKEEGSVCVVERIFPSLSLGGHMYGSFKGQIREFRLWSVIRTEEEINEYMRLSLNGEETGLYFYRDPNRGIAVSAGKIGNMVVSVIMPSHNRCPLNHFSLLSLNRQQFSQEQMEVIFLDDNSSDSTESLYELVNPGYSFIYIRSLTNRGRSETRNLGARIAVGTTLILLDAEMICGPDFVSTHVNHHLQGERKVVSASLRLRRIYTITDPGFSQEQIKQMKECYSGHPGASLLIERFIQGDRSPIQLIPFEMMFDPAHLKRWSNGTSFYENILLQYGNRFENFHYSWINFTTNNISMKRTFFEEIGGFDEHFEGFGWEDWELGYRAARYGAVFIHDDAVINFHQEHPISSDNFLQSQRNFLKFCEKYPEDIGIKLIALIMLPYSLLFPEVNEYLTEYKKIRAIYPERFKAFYHHIDSKINQLLERLQIDNGVTQPAKGLAENNKEEKAIANDIEAIREMSTFPKLMELYQLLQSGA